MNLFQASIVGLVLISSTACSAAPRQKDHELRYYEIYQSALPYLECFETELNAELEKIGEPEDNSIFQKLGATKKTAEERCFNHLERGRAVIGELRSVSGNLSKLSKPKTMIDSFYDVTIDFQTAGVFSAMLEEQLSKNNVFALYDQHKKFKVAQTELEPFYRCFETELASNPAISSGDRNMITEARSSANQKCMGKRDVALKKVGFTETDFNKHAPLGVIADSPALNSLRQFQSMMTSFHTVLSGNHPPPYPKILSSPSPPSRKK